MKTALFFSLAILLVAPSALADAVPPAPDDCPEGAAGDTDHGGPHCRPTECTAASECKKRAGYWGKDKSFVCKPDVGLCLKEVDTHQFKRMTAMDDCDDDSDCDDGAKRVVAKRCVVGEPAPDAQSDSGTDPSFAGPKGGDPPVPPKSKCGCDLTPASSTPSPWWLLGLGALAWRRRCAPTR